MDNVLNNALDLFPVTQTPQQAQVKLQRLTYSATNRGPTEIQSTLSLTLYDDGVQYMSTLDMNRAASYTFGYRSSHVGGGGGVVIGRVESVADEMWDLLVDMTLTKYTQHSPLALTKTLNLIRHVLLHGSEACVMNGELLYRIEMAVEPLRNLNTAIVEQRMVEHILNSEGIAGKDNDIVLGSEGIGHQLSQLGTRAAATMFKLRGGSVDRGYPVRDAATKLYGIIRDPNNLSRLRMQQRPSDSLVPIGNAKQVGYITDEGRLAVLQQKMAVEERAMKQEQLLEQQRMNQKRSNLAGTSAIDSFGGGYTSNVVGSGGKVVVGAAHSLADMIESAKYELEQHKTKHNQRVSSLKKGYTDDLSTRARQLEELERNRVEFDPEFVRKEKALQDALEYLEEMHRLDQEKVGDLLEGDLLGNGKDNLQGDGTAFGDNSDGADLLGLGGNATSWIPASYAGTDNQGAGVSTDLLGFGGQSSGYGKDVKSGGSYLPQLVPTNSSYIVGKSISLEDNANTHIRDVAGNSNRFNIRPSLVTGTTGVAENASYRSGVVTSHQLPSPTFSGTINDVFAIGGHLGTIRDEEAEAEKSRKMHLANGLFAGVVPAVSAIAQQKQPIMHSANNLNARAFDDLIPISDTSLNSSARFNNNSAFGTSDLTSFSVSPSSDPFGMGGPMGGGNISNVTSIAHPSSVPISSYPDPFGMGGPMGGSSISIVTSIAPPPSMPPPPPPMPPPPPPMPTTLSPPQAVDTLLGNNPSVEQMQEMIKQQQAQMNQMMNLMQQMRMQGSNNNSNIGAGAPPSY
ncbi:hypothetical protein ACHAXA_001803 [Cyclostephanos tholiformis]|uniref:Uncharacterized protein n=1 Tax=Cyclostephanos tholiformis TaxID=382380 RepID=A0ABD3SDP0_9STRA